MALSSFGKILTILDLFSVSRSVINVEIIAAELGISKPTSYRYLKELVAAGLLKRINGTCGDYILGSKIAVLDHVSRTTDPLIHLSVPFMQEIVHRSELTCLLTHLDYDYCIDLHHEMFKGAQLLAYGRGRPRPIYIGSSPKIILAHLGKKAQLDYYRRFSTQWSEVNFAHDQAEFMQHMRSIKKLGFYQSNGEIQSEISGLSVPIKFSSKEQPLALTVLSSTNRFHFLDRDKLVSMLQDSAKHIERAFQSLTPDQDTIDTSEIETADDED